MKVVLGIVCQIVFCGLLSVPSEASAKTSVAHESIFQKALKTLQNDFGTCQGWEKVHAAEILILMNMPEGIYPMCRNEEALVTSNARIGIWRVLAAVSPESEKSLWRQNIVNKVLDLDSGDRVVAIESLCKLGYVPSGEVLSTLHEFSTTATESDALYAYWALHLAGESIDPIVEGLASPNPLSRMRASYIIEKINPTDSLVISRLHEVAKLEPEDSIAFPYLMKAIVKTDPLSPRLTLYISQMKKVLASGAPSERLQVAEALAGRLSSSEILGYEHLLDNSSASVRSAIAWLVLSTNKYTLSRVSD